MDIDKKDIAQYLSEVKEAVENGRYRIDRNARRQDNINLFLDYVIDETKATFGKKWDRRKNSFSVYQI